MDQEEALKLLGLEPGATEDEIDRAYRRTSKHLHPNAPGGGDRERWEALLRARDLAQARSGADLVPVSLVRELVREQGRALVLQDKRQERAAESKRATQGVIRRHTSRLDEKKRSVWAMGVVAAALTLLTSLLKTIMFTEATFQQDAVTTGMISFFGLAAIALGFLGLGVQTQAQRLEQAIEDVTTQLSQRAEWLRLFSEVRRISNQGDLPWSPGAFDQAIARWSHGMGQGDHLSLASTASEIGSRDFGRLVIAKGLELELLSEKAEECDGEPRVSYGLRLDAAES